MWHYREIWARFKAIKTGIIQTHMYISYTFIRGGLPFPGRNLLACSWKWHKWKDNCVVRMQGQQPRQRKWRKEHHLPEPTLAVKWNIIFSEEDKVSLSLRKSQHQHCLSHNDERNETVLEWCRYFPPGRTELPFISGSLQWFILLFWVSA